MRTEKDNETICVYLRARPHTLSSSRIRIDVDENTVRISSQSDDECAALGSRVSVSEFRFDQVFGTQSSQNDVFMKAIKPSVQQVLLGFNSTVFAFGQTGTGKSYTMTGGSSNYSDRGAIPRTLEFMFRNCESQNSGMRIYISYMEIYSERAFDLLSSQGASSSESLNNVSPKEDDNGELRLIGLSKHLVRTEEEALDLLFLGDANRIVAETTLNDASTRSHCIFCITVEYDTASGDGLVRKGVLYLVDLAGSERLKNATAGSHLFSESRNINLSLHFLEQVVTALQDKARGSRSHIPYRNCLLTTVLRDALGGNCKTAMITTISLEDRFIDETISSCRFSQRVASIETRATVNEVMDSDTLIRSLRNKVSLLQEEIALLRSSNGHEETLTEEQLELLKSRVANYLDTPETQAEEFVCGTLARVRFYSFTDGNLNLQIRAAFPLFRAFYQNLKRLPDYVSNRQIEGNQRCPSHRSGSSSSIDGNAFTTDKDSEVDCNRCQYTQGQLIEFSTNPATAFNEFKRLNPDLCHVSETDMQELRRLCEAGKLHGVEAANARDCIEVVKSRLAINVDEISASCPVDPDLLNSVIEKKSAYQDAMKALKLTKAEIHSIQKRIEQKKILAQNKFQAWYNDLLRAKQSGSK